METLDRITQRPEIMGGKACIRGIRVTVGMIVGQIGAGRSVDRLNAAGLPPDSTCYHCAPTSHETYIWIEAVAKSAACDCVKDKSPFLQ
jgi:hypothetical protein